MHLIHGFGGWKVQDSGTSCGKAFPVQCNMPEGIMWTGERRREGAASALYKPTPVMMIVPSELRTLITWSPPVKPHSQHCCIVGSFLPHELWGTRWTPAGARVTFSLYSVLEVSWPQRCLRDLIFGMVPLWKTSLGSPSVSLQISILLRKINLRFGPVLLLSVDPLNIDLELKFR